MENFLSKQLKAKTNRIHPTKISSRLVGAARARPLVESEDVPGGHRGRRLAVLAVQTGGGDGVPNRDPAERPGVNFKPASAPFLD